ncbi:hypothetical protein BAE44_0009434 [Dichanthelium oligosanthes]|uniref:Reverse transcriptase zinc-binding domain-containing protein n=1 Tax=Dichanthelium oligosanthes TaxID=888268 RepID=A0A1E5VWU1_9POAL|nr:hypothetical protein BAE44_0009434 [Dichanthelium oligosanthes]
MAPFTSACFYEWHMNKLHLSGFADSIWANHATPRAKHFLCLVQKGRLPVSSLLHHCNIIDSPLCAYCGGHKDQGHLFLRCPCSKQVWHKLGWAAAPYIDSFRELWGLPELEHTSGRVSLPAVAPLEILNALVFSGVFNPPHNTLRAAATNLALWAHRVKHQPEALLLTTWSTNLCNINP